jgi:hypothetical protein
VNDNNRQTGNQQESQGCSAKGAPVLNHSDVIIAPGRLTAQRR